MMKKAGTKNPLNPYLMKLTKLEMIIEEIHHQLYLEALDPEQNTTFNDHYLRS